MPTGACTTGKGAKNWHEAEVTMQSFWSSRMVFRREGSRSFTFAASVLLTMEGTVVELVVLLGPSSVVVFLSHILVTMCPSRLGGVKLQNIMDWKQVASALNHPAETVEVLENLLGPGGPTPAN